MATLCGVSRQVVSAILQGKGSASYSKATKKRVEEMAQVCNFRPNRTWINATRNQHGIIGILVENPDSIYGRGNISGIVTEATQHGYMASYEVMQKKNEIPTFLREDAVDGLLLFEDLGKQIDQKILEYDIPAIYVNCNRFHSHGCLDYDDAGLMEQLAECFLQRGRSHILLIDSSEDSYHLPRAEALRKACKKRNMPAPIVSNLAYGNINAEGYQKRFEAYDSLLAEHAQINGLILNNTIFAPTLFEVLQKRKRAIPKDVSVVSLSNNPNLSYSMQPHLSSCCPADNVNPTVEAVKILIDAIKGNKKPKSRIIPYEIVDRGSM